MPTEPWRRAETPIVLFAAVVFLTGGGACSFAFVDAAPTTHRQLSYFECTSSNALPTIDLVVGALAGLGGAAAISDGSGSSYPNNGFNTDAAIAVGEAALFVASAVYGYEKTSSCREAKAELIQRLPRGPAIGPGPSAPFVPNDPWTSPPPGAFAPPPVALPPPVPPAAGSPPLPTGPPPRATGGPPPTLSPTSPAPAASDAESPRNDR